MPCNLERTLVLNVKYTAFNYIFLKVSSTHSPHFINSTAFKVSSFMVDTLFFKSVSLINVSSFCQCLCSIKLCEIRRMSILLRYAGAITIV